MSTEHQRYSTEDQGKAIRDYAAKAGLEIVATYADQGKSGLNIGGRDGLRRLLADVASGVHGFSVVLVYDVSRWGRFQDADESAFYEYQCRRAGVRVEYCAEPFKNDGSLGSDIQKMLKRKMAGEYSRELSVKVFAGQCRLIELGFRQGGAPGFGLRRQLVDERGVHKSILVRREQKSIQTDRVLLVPGPDNEVETVVRIYNDFVERGCSESEIAVSLNKAGIATDLGRPWTRGTIHEVLVNPKYAGDNVWNRGSFKLKKRRVRNGPELWVRARDAFAPIVDRLLFDAAQAIVAARSARVSDAEMLEALRCVLARHGGLSALLIDETEGCPSSSAYRSRFGSLIRSYHLIGHRPVRDFAYVNVNRRLRERYPLVMKDTIERLRSAGGCVERTARDGVLEVNGEFFAKVILSRCRETDAGARRWIVRLDDVDPADVTVAVRMQPGEEAALDYYLFPALDSAGGRLRLAARNEAGLDAYRFETLDALVELVRRVPVGAVA